MQILKEIKNKEHIIWDWNGTILNDVDHAIETMNRILSDHDLEQLDKDRYRKIFGFPIKDYYDRLGFDYSKRSFEDLCHDFVDSFMNGVTKCDLFEYMPSVLKEVKDSQKTQSVLSASDQENLDFMIGNYQLKELFDHVFGIEDKYGRSKVHRGQELIETSGIARENTIMIGDTVHDLEVGQELGIDVVLVSHGHQCRTILERSHNIILSI